MADRVEIYDALLRYCRGVDRCDAELIMSAFHPDAVDNHGPLSAVGSEIPDRLLSFVRAHSVRSMHVICNHLVDVGGDIAQSEAYFVRWSLKEGEGEMLLDTRWGRYIDEFQRRNGEWRIANRVVVNEWTDVRAIEPNGTDSQYVAGERSTNDPVYTALQLLRKR